MEYIKQNLLNGQTLDAKHIDHIEEGIMALIDAVNKLNTSDGATTTAAAVRIADVELLATKWVGSASPYSQVVTVEGVTKYSQVDLKPSVEQLTIFHDKDLAFVTENVNGVVTVYAIGDKPANDYTIQASITEVIV